MLSVLLQHLNCSIFSGGFVGVDIFFVLSGFLITSQVYKEARDGTFSLRQFYKRRINRILPALLTVAIATVAVGAILISPEDLVRLTKSAISATTGVSNVFFWSTYGTYFSANAAEAPLLHTWSLGVEEQFYVIWPLLILLLLKLNKRYWLASFALLTAGAIAVSQIGTSLVASASYYLLPTRFFELMIGGMLALILSHKQLESRYYSSLCSIVGFALIAGSILFLNKDSSFPGINALWPCLGAALLIWGGTKPGSAFRILTIRPMVFLGLISYSLYLWHWPIISYLNYLNIEIGPLVGSTVAVGSILLAWLSWRFVEVPMRRSGAALSFQRVFFLRFAIPIVALFIVGGTIIHSNGFPQRFDPRVAEFDQMLDANSLRPGCDVPTAMFATLPSANCRLGEKKAHLDGILIGDSFANHFTGMIDVMGKANGLSFMDYTMQGCPPILGYRTDKGAWYVRGCLKRNEMAYHLIAANHYDRVILAGHWPRNPEAGEQLASSIGAVLKTGAKVTLILNNETIKGAASCPSRRLMYRWRNSCDSLRQGPPEYIKKIRLEYPQVRFIDPNQVICHADRCSPVLNGKLLYRDDDHLNDIGSREIGQELLIKGVSL